MLHVFVLLSQWPAVIGSSTHVWQQDRFQFKYSSVLNRFLFLVIPGSQSSMNESCESPSSSSSSSCPPLLTPTGSGPDVIGMFDMDSSDMAMSSSSSQQNFDPRRHSFSEEELKPQPMIKKARKILVPDNMKVSELWDVCCNYREITSSGGQLHLRREVILGYDQVIWRHIPWIWRRN